MGPPAGSVFVGEREAPTWAAVTEGVGPDQRPGEQGSGLEGEGWRERARGGRLEGAGWRGRQGLQNRGCSRDEGVLSTGTAKNKHLLMASLFLHGTPQLSDKAFTGYMYAITQNSTVVIS